MRLAVSNIAWQPADQAAILPLLRDRGVTGIEVAPTKLWPDWHDATPAAATAYRERLADQGFAVPALQAILFGKPDCTLFDPAGARWRRADIAVGSPSRCAPPRPRRTTWAAPSTR